MSNNTSPSENEQLKKEVATLRRNSIIWGILLLLVMVVIVCVSIYYIADLAREFTIAIEMVDVSGENNLSIQRNNLLSADYLAIIIPILVALAGSFVAFLGMSRLKMFDDRIDKIRSDMLEEMEKLVKSEVAVGRNDFSNNLTTSIDNKLKEIKTETENGINKLQAKHEESQNKLDQSISDFGQKYDWLEAIISAEVGELDIATVADAHTLTESLREKKPSKYIFMIKKIVEKVCDADNFLSGQSADYHNLSAELARGNMYSEAICVLEKGHSLFPRDTDLLSDIIEYSTKNSQFEKAKEAVNMLMEIDKQGWTWRCFEFTVDYYRAIGEYENAYNMCIEGTQSLPYDEHAYRSKAELEMILSPGEEGVEKAIITLDTVLKKGLSASQCAQLLAKIYFNKGMLQESIDAASRAIIDLAEDQPSIGVAAILSSRGFAYDKLFMQKVLSGTNDLETASLAIQDYELSIGMIQSGMGQLSPITIKQMLTRLTILKELTA